MKITIDTESFSGSMRYHRHRAQLKLENVAFALGISPSTVSRIERGGVPDINTYATACYWMGCDFDKFLKRASSRTPIKKKSSIKSA